MGNFFSPRNIAIFYLFALSTQFIAFEGMAISPFKVFIMAISPLIWLITCPSFTKATLYSVIYLFITTFALYIQYDNVRSSTLWYSAFFFCMFNLYYSLVYVKQVFSLEVFTKTIRSIILAYATIVILQQICTIIGIRYIPFINLVGMPYYSSFKFNSLAIEPSHAARVLAVAFYVFIECLCLKNDKRMSISEIYKLDRLAIIAFLYTMISIGSGTAIVAIAILSLYFIRSTYIVLVIVMPLLLFVYSFVDVIDFEPLTRAVNTFNTALSGNSEEMARVDNSAAARVNIIINTVKYFDITDIKLWFGYGVDSGHKVVSAISDYGLISYLSKLVLFFGCCFTNILSLPVLMFILLFSFNIGNIAYGWACLMMLSGLKYFKKAKP